MNPCGESRRILGFSNTEFEPPGQLHSALDLSRIYGSKGKWYCEATNSDMFNRVSDISYIPTPSLWGTRGRLDIHLLMVPVTK